MKLETIVSPILTVQAAAQENNTMTLDEFILSDMDMLRKLAARGVVDKSYIEETADMRLLDLSQRAMREKLSDARRKGRGGWWNDAECSIEQLRSMLREHVEKGDMRDVMNLAAMVFMREIADAQHNADVTGLAPTQENDK